MNADRFTVKTQEAVQAAVSLAAQRRNPQALPEHLLSALLDQEQGAVPGVLRKAGADEAAIARELDAALAALPTLGSGGEASQASSELVQVLQNAEGVMRDLGTSTSRPITSCSRSPSRRLAAPPTPCAPRGATPDALRQALNEVRGPHRVTDPNAGGQLRGAGELRRRPHRARRATASSTRSSAATTRSAASSRSSRRRRRTTPS